MNLSSPIAYFAGNTLTQQLKMVQHNDPSAQIFSEPLLSPCKIIENEISSHSQFSKYTSPWTIFDPHQEKPSLEFYMKTKIHDKISENLEEIRKCWRLFLSYSTTKSDQEDHHEQEASSPRSNQLFLECSKKEKQSLLQFCYKKNLPENSLLYITIKPSRIHRCNIIVKNYRGEVLQFIHNTYRKKREQKISGFLNHNRNNFVVVLDHCISEIDRFAIFQSNAIKAGNCLYKIEVLSPKMKHHYHQKLQQNKSKTTQVVFELIGQGMIIKSISASEMLNEKQIKDVFQHLITLNRQQTQLLEQVRGKKRQGEINLMYDYAIFNHWKLTQARPSSLITCIVQLFENKIKLMGEKLAVEDKVYFHEAQLMDICKTCCFCQFNGKKGKKKMNTSKWTCSKCSKEDEKDIYLCLLCFDGYHSLKEKKKMINFQRYERRARKIKKNHKKQKDFKIKLEQKQSEKDVEDGNQIKTQFQNLTQERDRLVIELQKESLQMFEDINKMIRDNRLGLAEKCIMRISSEAMVAFHSLISENKMQKEEQPSIIMKEEEMEVFDQEDMS